MGNFFGKPDYGPAEGAYSWQHLLFVAFLMTSMVLLAILLGLKNKNKEEHIKNKVLIWAAFLIDGFELFKIAFNLGGSPDGGSWKRDLPLFLCSIQLITIPLAAFSKGRFKEASLDFVLIFGILGGILGTVGATQNYNAYPAFSWPNVVSGITHTISAFASIYIAVSGMTSMKKKNIPITFGILFGFGITAYIVNLILDYNYMFLMNHDGTPYVLLYNLVNGNKILYPISVMLLFVVYISMFYAIYLKIQKRKLQKLQ
jgi:uncharacterized membrane protein YwaF